ncbi:MAG: membrane protein insertase YidC [Gammaproteobacteria bacterium]|nr:membrane protein insertase YidC [Gammaproteobacteria bacterium]MDP2139667.1 membrane protein insertase YidC [Gammaproteobacteria bacterium]MDP2348871.1 membrane protein insertase YidC [Gammaproteobacteria bacterium]
MDSIKYLIFGGLAIVSYLLLLAWQEDYPQVPATAPITEVQTSTSNASFASDVPTVAPVAVTPTVTDIPVLASSPATTPVDSNTRITVRTDVLDVVLDRNGGDIIQVSLPAYRKQIDVENDPFVLLESNGPRVYVAKSGLVGRNGIDSASRALYQAPASNYVLSETADSIDVSMTHTDALGVQITKRFSFKRGSYLITISYEINNASASTWAANLFGQINRTNFEDPSSMGGVGMRSFLGFAATSTDDPYYKVKFEDVAGGLIPHELTGGWIGLSQHYFLSAWIPPAEMVNTYSMRLSPQNQNEYIGGFTSQEFSVAPGTTSTQSINFYAGPKDQYVLRDISPNLDLTIDYGVLWFIASPIYWLLRQINSFVGNYGWSILLLTVCVKGLFYKLSATSYRSMANMRRVMPKMVQLKERYGDDKMKLQKATMELYQKEKINPFGGCLPMLVQMPVFIALYWVLMESVELRQAPFVLWINDLSVMDPFFVLPLLMGASMYAQSLLSPAPADPMQAKIMRFMPVVMTVFFLWFPAGLVLYWLANSVLGIMQQWYITRKIEKEFEAKKA